MVRKTWSILFALLFLAVIFVACGTTPADTTPVVTTPADTTPADTTPADTTPASTPPWTSPPQPLFCSYGVTTLDEAIKVVVEEDYYKTVLLEKTPGGWLTETGERYHEALLDSIRRLGYFPTLSCQAEHEKNPTAVNERYGIIEFFPSEHGFDNVAYFCGCYGDVLFCEIHVLDEEYVSVTSIIDYFIEALDTVPEDNGWRRIQLMRNGTIVPALCKESINGERNVIRFIEDGLYLSLSIAKSLDSIAVAEAVEIIKLPYPDEPIALEKDFLAQLRLEETTYEDICAWSGSEGTEIAPNVYEWQMGYCNAKTVRLYFMPSENGDAVLAGYRTSNALTDAPSVLTTDLFMSQIERGKTTYADLCTLAGEEGDFLEPLLCEWTLDGSRSQTVRVTLEAPLPEAPVEEWIVTDFTRLDGEKVILFEDFVNLVRNNTVTYRDVYEFMGRHGVLEWTNNYSWMIGENFSQKVFVSFDPAKEGESLYDRVEHGWGYD